MRALNRFTVEKSRTQCRPLSIGEEREGKERASWFPQGLFSIDQKSQLDILPERTQNKYGFITFSVEWNGMKGTQCTNVFARLKVKPELPYCDSFVAMFERPCERHQSTQMVRKCPCIILFL